MSQYPEPAPYGAYGAYGGGAPPPRRTRPSARWFVVAGTLLALGLALAIPAIVLSIAAFTRVEATIAGDGVARTVEVEADTEYLLWKRPAETVDCRVVDGSDGTQLALRGLGATSYTRDVGSGPWEGALTFEATSTSVEITCAPGSSAVEVGQKPRIVTLVGGLFLGLVVPILVAVGAVVMLIVVGILFATGAAPNRAPQPPGGLR